VSATVVVLCPVLGRPKRAQPLWESLHATAGRDARLLFLCSPGDDEKIEACRRVRQAETIIVPFEHAPGDYARKINYGLSVTRSDWIFQGADDLRFHPGWLQEALQAGSRRAGGRVVGTQDLGNRMVMRGRHSTHSLVHRSYVEEGTVDEPGKLMHEGYRHNFCDTEMVETALSRGEFIFARRAVVEHLHPNWKKGEMDATYKLGLGDFRVDQLHFMGRRKLWRITARDRRRSRMS
jgi:hypothetical protein